VSTSDVSASTLAGHDPLENRLLDLFAFGSPPDVIARLDERIERAIVARQSVGTRQVSRPRLRPGRRAGIAGLLAAVLVVGGASGGLYELLFSPFNTLPWDRGQVVDVSDVVDGYRVTIDRAYADATRLMLAVTVVDELERPGTTQLMAMATVVTDQSGTYESGGGATSSPLSRTAAANVIWKTPPVIPLPSGRRTIHVVMPHIEIRDDATPPPTGIDEWNPWRRHPGPWTFDFELTVAGGTEATPDATAELHGLRVGIARIVAAPSVVRLELTVDGGPAGSTWSPFGEVRHRGRVLAFVQQNLASAPIQILTNGGVDDASGEWTVEVRELARTDGAGVETRLTGPWILRFTLP
jgi:hypothetical protein